MDVFRENLLPRMPEYEMAVFRNNRTRPERMVSEHWHDAYEILYIRDGQARQVLNTEEFCVGAGDLVVICPGDIHATDATASNGCHIDVLLFTDRILPGAKELRTGVLRNPAPETASLFDGLLRHADESRGSHLLILRGLVSVLTGVLILSGSEHPDYPRSPQIARICEYLEQSQDLRLEQTAARFNYSPQYLSRKFHAQMGIPYRQWCDRLRMRKAAEMLHYGTLSVSAVAEAVGYCDDSSFIRAFKKTYGVSPNQYRRRKLSIHGAV